MLSFLNNPLVNGIAATVIGGVIVGLILYYFFGIGRSPKDVESKGGPGGSVKIGGQNNGTAIGGNAGGGGPGGQGGAGGSVEISGDNEGFAMGGEGGESGQVDRGGKGGRGPLQVIMEVHPEVWREISHTFGITPEDAMKYGRGGDGAGPATKDGIKNPWYKSLLMKYLGYPIVATLIASSILVITQDNQSKQNVKSSTTPTAKIIVMGGGGSGGAADGGCAGGGGGSGAIVNVESFPIQAGTYKVVVGEGGINGSDGGTSSFNGVINAEGGKGGASGDCVIVNNVTTDKQK